MYKVYESHLLHNVSLVVQRRFGNTYRIELSLDNGIYIETGERVMWLFNQVKDVNGNETQMAPAHTHTHTSCQAKWRTNEKKFRMKNQSCIVVCDFEKKKEQTVLLLLNMLQQWCVVCWILHVYMMAHHNDIFFWATWIGHGRVLLLFKHCSFAFIPFHGRIVFCTNLSKRIRNELQRN